MLVGGCTADVAMTTPREAVDQEADSDDTTQYDDVLALIASQSDSPTSQKDAATDDLDGDGISDATEELLLRRYRPFYRFSQDHGRDETFRPADTIAQLSNAQLRTDLPDGGGTSDPLAGCGEPGDAHLNPPDQLYTCRTDTSLVETRAKSTYALNLDNTRYHGVSFDQAESDATGLHGHVVPTTINGHPAYKIEYWQFFGFNNQDITIFGLGSFGDHEGDWTSVQVWFDRVEHRLVKVRYLIHGKDATFDIAAMTPGCTDCTIDMQGDNYNPTPPNFFDDVGAYSNNAAQFYIDDHRFKHVVVYLERGAHEFWPGSWGKASYSVGPFSFSLNPHNGSGPAYLVPDVTDRLFNMGEVDHPLTHAGALILPFNGFWGSTNTDQVMFWGGLRRSPVGPALHCEWTWPDGITVQGCEN
jgi:hypothetical protein